MARLCRILWAYVLALALVAAAAHSASAQPACASATVERLAPLPTSADLTTAVVTAADPERDRETDPATAAAHTLVVAGRDGALLVSDDAGLSFRPATLPDALVGADWRQLASPAPGVIIAATDDGRALARSDDAGATWRALELPRGLRGPIAWADPDTAIFAPDGQLAARTTDAGATWETAAVEPPAALGEAVATLDEDTAFAVGRSGLSHTTDGGRTWPTIALTDDPATEWLHAVAFLPDGHTGYVAGNGVLFRTRDAGRTWQPISIDERDSLIALALPDADTVYALTRNGAMWRSFDAGETFDVVELPQGDLADITFIDRDRGYAVGGYGGLLVTEDAGVTWRSLRRGGDRTLHAIVPLGPEADAPLLAVGAGGTVLLGAADALEPPAKAPPPLPALYDAAWDGEQLVTAGQGALVTAALDALDSAAIITTDQALHADVFARVAARAPGEFYAVLGGQLVRVDTRGRQAAVTLDADHGTAQRIAVHAGTLFVATSNGVLASTDGVAFRRLGPVGLRVTALAALDVDRALVRLEGGALAELDGDTAALVGLEPGFPVVSARLTDDGVGWAGAGFGLAIRVDPATGAATVRVLPGAEQDAVVAIEFRDATHGAALTSSGRVYLSGDAGESWTEHAGPWPSQGVGAAGGIPGSETARLERAGALVWLGQAWLAAGPGGQARRVAASAVDELETPILADLEAALRVDGRLYLAGGGRTVIVSDDDGASWAFLTDDLAPERIVGLDFDAAGVGTLATATGGLLAFGLELAEPLEDEPDPTPSMGTMPRFANLGREPGPLVALRRTDDGRLWLINGDDELLFSSDRGENWEVVSAMSWQQPSLSVADFDVHGESLLLVGNGRIQIGQVADTERDPLGPAMLPALSGLHAAPDGGSALALADDRQRALVVAADTSMQCLETELPSGVRDAAPHGDGWIVVGDGGLVARIR